MQLSLRLTQLCHVVAKALHEIGCPCIANRLCGEGTWEAFTGTPAWVSAAQRYPLVSIMPKLVPLTKGLAQAGYYDTALACAEAACRCEPTVDMDLIRAFLLLVLGDTQEAASLYNRTLSRLGGLPPEAFGKLHSLALTHAEEEDIAELYRSLVQYQAA